MKYLLAFILVTSIAHAQSTTPRNGDERDYKVEKNKKGKVVAEKNVKTTGEISTSGCVLASGKTVSVGEQDYEECRRQIGTTKNNSGNPKK